MHRYRRRLAALAVAGLSAAGVAGCGSTSHPLLPAPPNGRVERLCQGVAGCALQSVGGRPVAPAFGAPPQGDFGLKPLPLTARSKGHRRLRSTSSTLQGYDSVVAAYVPYGAPVAPCYSTGTWANCAGVAARHPQHSFSIATYYGGVGRALDIEPGDAVPSQAPGFVRYMHARGVKLPIIYTDAAEWPQVRSYLSSAGFSDGNSYLSWLADYDNNPAIPSGFDGKQYATSTTLDYDRFSVRFFTTPKPPPPPPDPKYTNYCHAAPTKGETCGPFRVSWRKKSINERWVVEGYDANRKLTQTRARVNYERILRADLSYLANRLLPVIKHASRKSNFQAHRYGREDCLRQRAYGHVTHSWSDCFRRGKFAKVPA